MAKSTQALRNQVEGNRVNDQPDRMNRRRFLRLGVLISTTVAVPGVIVNHYLRGRDTPPLQWFESDPWRTLSSVQEHMLPSTSAGTPGAGDLRAIYYLRNTLTTAGADTDARNFILDGVRWLNDMTADEYRKPFVELDPTQRETVLRKVENSRTGRNWLSRMMTYLIEAILADPIYGGNPDGLGWKWLQHQPGYPTPPPGKLWYQLREGIRTP